MSKPLKPATPTPPVAAAPDSPEVARLKADAEDAQIRLQALAQEVQAARNEAAQYRYELRVAQAYDIRVLRARGDAVRAQAPAQQAATSKAVKAAKKVVRPVVTLNGAK